MSLFSLMGVHTIVAKDTRRRMYRDETTVRECEGEEGRARKLEGERERERRRTEEERCQQDPGTQCGAMCPNQLKTMALDKTQGFKRGLKPTRTLQDCGL